MDRYALEAEQTLYDVFHKIKEAVLDAFIWLGDLCLSLLDWLAQARHHLISSLPARTCPSFCPAWVANGHKKHLKLHYCCRAPIWTW